MELIELIKYAVPYGFISAIFYFTALGVTRLIKDTTIKMNPNDTRDILFASMINVNLRLVFILLGIAINIVTFYNIYITPLETYRGLKDLRTVLFYMNALIMVINILLLILIQITETSDLKEKIRMYRKLLSENIKDLTYVPEVTIGCGKCGIKDCVISTELAYGGTFWVNCKNEKPSAALTRPQIITKNRLLEHIHTSQKPRSGTSITAGIIFTISLFLSFGMSKIIDFVTQNINSPISK